MDVSRARDGKEILHPRIITINDTMTQTIHRHGFVIDRQIALEKVPDTQAHAAEWENGQS